MTKIEPIGDNVLVRRDKPKEVTEGGILLPDVAKAKSSRGKVLAVGEGGFDEKGNRTPMSVKVGDSVVFPTYSGSNVDIDGEEYLLIHEGDLLAVIK